MAKKLFVSLPMRGFEIDDIRNEMQAIKTLVERDLGEEFELINSLMEDDISDEINPCYYLGNSIKLLATADACVFHPQWAQAHGCMIEHAVCALYGIPYFHIGRNPDYPENSPETNNDIQPNEARSNIKLV